MTRPSASPATMLRDARAVDSVPKWSTGGFIFGAEGGDGVAATPKKRHGWKADRNSTAWVRRRSACRSDWKQAQLGLSSTARAPVGH